MQPVTSISGIVVNDEPKITQPPEENIYFEPRRQPTSIKENESIAEDRNVENKKRDQKDHVGKEPSPVKRSGTFDSFFNDSSASSPSGEKITGLKLDFPPVFTWSTDRKPPPEESSTEDTTLESSSPPSHPAQSTVESKETSATFREATLNANHESLQHVSSHLHDQLLEVVKLSSQAIYRAASVSSNLEAGQALRNQFDVHLNFLIYSDRPLKTGQDPVTWDSSLKSSIGGMCRLLNFFIPLEFLCDVTTRFWGGIHDLITIIPQICEPSKMKELTERTHNHRMSDSYFIVDLDDARFSSDLLNDKDIEAFELDLKVEDCPKCTKNRQFSTRADAVNHLSTHHCRIPAGKKSEKSPQSRWALVLSYGEYLTFLCRIDGQKTLHQLRDQVESLEDMAVQIQLGVSESGGGFDRETYRIPSSLVDAFQNFLMMVVTAAHMAKAISQARESYKERDPPPSFLLFSELHSITGFAVKSWDFMEKAGSDIMLMTQTGEIFDVVSHEVVSPSLVLALIIDEIHFTDSKNNRVNMIEIYRGYMLDLQFQAFRNPQRRLLQDIYFFTEELLIARDIILQQMDILFDYLEVLRPASFHITTESRISSYDLEDDKLWKLLDRFSADCDTIEEFLEKGKALATTTRNGVDVRQEDQGKAILIFTIVTVVFTPLSFVTSYLGMNTIDIRNMRNSQTLFWAISIPLTAVIISIVLFVALQAERVRDAIEVLFQPRLSKGRRDVFKTSHEDDTNDLDSMLGQLPVSNGKKPWRQRLRGGRNFKDQKSQSDSTLKV
ncbi:Mg2+ transporter protein CorA-like/Zinc transport protein ZntB [Penicillium herquei]|nr:Mg2+ transporter protein CorA-like/Zinc transport protein ZntB [Penicillium herquei]